MTETQPDFVRALQQAAAYPHAVEGISLLETHISWVFLTGAYVYKIKKPVSMGFLDFTDLASRRYYCRQEIELNRRLTRKVYKRVVPLTRAEDAIRLDGDGPVIEYAVQMKQLSRDDSLEVMLTERALDDTRLNRLAEILARFYEEAAAGPEIDAAGSRAAIAENCRDNFDQLAAAADDIIDHRRLAVIRAATDGFLENHADRFDERVQQGRIRDGHGDLRTDHIYFTDTGIQIIDCIEFNPRFRYGDVASDLAFLAMEMDARGYPRQSGQLLSNVIRHSGDQQLFSLLDFYKCYRAMVRAKVNYLRRQQADVTAAEAEQLAAQIRNYLGLAYRYAVQFSRPVLWVVFGLIATGKSTVGRAVSEALGIRLIRSDVVRKELLADTFRQTGVGRFGEGMYTPAATALTYGTLLLRAQEELEQGRSVVLDATFSRQEDRQEALRLAKEAGALIIFVQCRCREEIIRQRLEARAGSDSVSDARVQHLDRLQAVFEPPAELSPHCLVSVDTEQPLEESLRAIFTYTATPNDCLERDWLAPAGSGR